MKNVFKFVIFEIFQKHNCLQKVESSIYKPKIITNQIIKNFKHLFFDICHDL